MTDLRELVEELERLRAVSNGRCLCNEGELYDPPCEACKSDELYEIAKEDALPHLLAVVKAAMEVEEIEYGDPCYGDLCMDFVEKIRAALEGASHEGGE